MRQTRFIMTGFFIHGLVGGLVSAAAGTVYFYVYQEALGCHFNQVVNTGAIAAASLISCMLMASSYAALHKLNKQRLTASLNIFFALISFVSIIGPIGMSLPLDIKNPELFPGLVVPMHFFPVLAFVIASPYFSQVSK